MNVPNALSLFRLCLVPVYLIVFFSELKYAHLIAIGIFLLAGITDIVDGYIARKYNQITMLGRILDPLADKFMVWAALISLSVSRVIPWFVSIIYFIKEVTMGIGGAVVYRKLRDVPPSNIWGKASTVLFYVAIILSITFDLTGLPVALLFGAALLSMVIALAQYVKRGLDIVKENTPQ